MFLPSNFETTISDIFYDKDFIVDRQNKTKDSEGGVTSSSMNVGKYRGNVQRSLSGSLRKSLGIEERGLVDSIDLAITTRRELDIITDDIVIFEGQDFTVKSSIIFDSHLLLICERIK